MRATTPCSACVTTFCLCLLCLIGGRSQAQDEFLVEESVFATEAEPSDAALLEDAAPEGVLSLALDPLNSGVVYAGTRGWGLIKSSDLGYSWSSAGPELEGMSVTAVAVHPNGRVVYAGTQTRGVFLSINGGITFRDAQIGLPDPEIRDLAIHPFTPLTIFAATAVGLAWSQDGGNLWQPFPGGGPSEALDIELSVLRRRGAQGERDARAGTADSTALAEELSAELRAPSVLFVTGDEGLWGCDYEPSCRLLLDRLKMERLLQQAVGSGLSAQENAALLDVLSAPQQLRLAVSRSDPHILYAASELGVFRSADRGQSWAGFFELGGIKSIGVDPDDPNFLWAGTDRGLWFSRNGGQTFEQVEAGADLRLHVLIVDPTESGRLFAGSDDGRILVGEGGAFRIATLGSQQMTTGSGARPAPGPRMIRIPARPEGRSRFGPHINQMVNSLVVDARFPHILYSGTRYGVFRSYDQGATWESRNEGLGTLDVLDLVVDPADSYSRHPEEEAVLIAGTNGSGVFRSQNSGRSWQSVAQGPRDAVIRALAIDPADPDYIYAGARSRGIYRSSNRGLTWLPAHEQPRDETGELELGIRDVVVSGTRILAATDSGKFFASLDGGLSWQQLGALSMGNHRELEVLRPLGLDPDALHVNALSAHSSDDSLLHAGTAFGIFRSEDGGRDWRRTVAWHNVATLAHHPSNPDILVAGTAQGGLRSTDGGLTWKRIKLSDPISAVVFDPVFPGRFYAGNDHGEVLAFEAGDVPRVERRRMARPEILPKVDDGAVPLTDQPRTESSWEEPRRKLRRGILSWLAAAPDEELAIEDPRALMLLTLETYLRGETAISEDSKIKLSGAVLQLMQHIQQLQEQYVSHWGAGRTTIDPTSRSMAVEYFWDDGLQSHSETRVFDLRRLHLYERSEFPEVGPSIRWKELHDRHRRPESWAPRQVLSGAGRFLGWSIDGSTLISQSGWDQITLWSMDAEGSRTLRGLSSPARAASLDPSGSLLAWVGLDGRPLWTDLRTGARRLLTREIVDGGIRHVAMAGHGLFTIGANGTIRYWPLEGEDTVVLEEGSGFDRIERSPNGRWWLLGRNNERRGEPEDGLWGRTYFLELSVPRGSLSSIGQRRLWSTVHWSPKSEWLALENGAQGVSALLDLRSVTPLPRSTATSPPTAHDLELTRYLHFDPFAPLLATSNALWHLGQSPEVYRERPHRSPSLILNDLDADRFWRRFGQRSPPAGKYGMPVPLKRARLGSGQISFLRAGRHRGFNRELHTADGRRVLAFDDQGRLFVSYFDQLKRDTRLPAQDRYVLSPVVASQLVDIRRHQLPSSGKSPAEQWPVNLTRDAPWDRGSFPDFLTWGCTLAGRNLTPREWQRFFGDEAYRATCRFEKDVRP